MKVSLDWLKDYVDYRGTPHDLVDLLARAGFEVDDLAQVGDDWMLDVEITSNRPDCLGHIGIAREIATATGTTIRFPDVAFEADGPAIDGRASVKVADPALCGRYTARLVDEVRVGPSPDWMVRRLETVGLRAINNVVDITNYVLMEVGQPLHAFDFAKITDGKIIVRTAKAGETITTIDESKLKLDDQTLVIADAAVPVALAGVMGGLDSEVSDATTSVLLESAHFDPLCIRRTARALTMQSDSSFRFERNVDQIMLDWASQRAMSLLVQLTGGRAAAGMIDCWAQPLVPVQVTMRLSRMRALLGIDVPLEKVMAIFTSLDFEPVFDNDDAVTCTIPSWRRTDVSREADLIEEVIRIHGFEHIPLEPKIHIRLTSPDAFQRTRRTVCSTLNACGYFEAVNIGFIEDALWKPFAPDDFEPLRVRDASRRTNNALRCSLLPSLLAVRKRNQDVGNEGCHFYELAAIHQPDAKAANGAQEHLSLALLCDGDFRDLRGVIEAVIASLDPHAALNCVPHTVRWAADGAAAQLRLGDTVLGSLGQVSQGTADVFSLQSTPWLAELNVAALVKLEGRIASLTPLMRFPPIRRDFSLVVDESVTWQAIRQAAESQAPQQLRDMTFVDIYRGKGIDSGRKCVTLSMEFRDENTTLTHEQVDEFQQPILNALAHACGATLRA